MKESGVELYPNRFEVDCSIAELLAEFGERSAEDLETNAVEARLAGRIISLRKMGKASFLHIQDDGCKLQIYVKRDEVGVEAYAAFKKFDVGDITGVAGRLFRTKTGELTLLAGKIVLLGKSIRPLPEKYHWLTDKELRYRQRYLDLIGNQDVRDLFIKRTRIIQAIRDFMNNKGFLEVETPMMQTVPGGATAKPFETFHNALGIPIYLRVAPELYLKRLIIGGFNKVYEINRNFRNEGMSVRHNPEFTMLEFYQAYSTYEQLMDFTEELFCSVAETVNGSMRVTYQGNEIDLTPPWRRIGLLDALVSVGKVDPEVLNDIGKAIKVAESLEIKLQEGEKHGKILAKIFEELIEPKLIQPTFVVQYPTDVSPLARRNDKDPSVVDRFELFICGRELANAFSELNDPDDQRGRFLAQVEERTAGDEEAHLMDEDYVKALEYGMPPTAGEGIGIDRLVMLFTDAASIRDVILFPHMKPL
jgi:lysyl-tRNA synthetase, class II